MNDYLWDRSGPPDPFVAELEDVLAPLALRAGPNPPQGRSTIRFVRAWALPLAGAAAVIFAVALSIAVPRSGQTWRIEAITGVPRLSSAQLQGPTELGPGAWLETDASSTARIRSDDVGRITVNPDSRLRLTKAHDREHRIELASGSIDAFIIAPPKVFIVDTPAVTAVDMGCSYRLEVDDAGNGSILVTTGWVFLELAGARTARVPSGAACAIRAGLGAGTPRFTDAPQGLIEALDRFDTGDLTALELILSAARPRDSLTVWHLAQGAQGEPRRLAIARLDELAPRPPAVKPGFDVSDKALDDWWQTVDESW